jgi:hypothetical protein
MLKLMATLILVSVSLSAQGDSLPRFIQVQAHTKQERSAIADSGMSIEAVRSDSVWGFATPNALRRLRVDGRKILGDFDFAVGRGGHERALDFPPEDARFHNYAWSSVSVRREASSVAIIARYAPAGPEPSR